MPIDLEMLLSATGHSFFPYSSINSYNYSDNTYDHRLSYSQSHCAPRSSFRPRELFQRKPQHGDYVKNTSYKSIEKTVCRQEKYGVSKKKVSFADDKGYKLVEVCEIPGAPKWADDVITLLIGSTKRSVVKEKKWKVAFDSPPWTDDRLLNLLEANMVVLENISVKEGADDFLSGTIKVKNLAFEKNVFVRLTFDRWLSYIDVPCTYVKPEKRNSSPSVYDTFCFRSKILPVASRYEVIEFSICYQCNGKEYWDNNNGVNYRITVEYVKSSVPDLPKTTHVPRPCNTQFRPRTSRSSEELIWNYKFLHDMGQI